MGFKIFNFGTLKLSKNYLKSIPEYHLNFIANSSVATSDLTVFLKLLVGFQSRELNNEILIQCLVVHQLTIFPTVSAKIYEYVIYYESYVKKLSRSRDPIDVAQAHNISAHVQKIKSQPEFSVVEKVRDDATNHYQIKEPLESIEKYGDDHKFLMYFSDMPSASFFPIGEEIGHLHLLDNDDQKGFTLEQMIRWTAITGGILGNMHRDNLVYIFDRYPPDRGRESKLFIDDKLVSDINTELPIFYYHRK